VYDAASRQSLRAGAVSGGWLTRRAAGSGSAVPDFDSSRIEPGVYAKPTCDRSPQTPVTLTEFVHPFTREGLFGLVEELCGSAFVIFDLGCRGCLLCCGRCRIQFAVTLLDPSRADMTLYHHADMVRAIAGTCRVKFLAGLAGSQGKDALAEARRAGFASR